MKFGALAHDRERSSLQQICADWQAGRPAPARTHAHVRTRSGRDLSVEMYWGNISIDGEPAAFVVAVPSLVKRRHRDHAAALAMSELSLEQGTALKSLSPRQRSVLELIAQGRTNREIAQTLGIEEATAKVHVHRLLRKINARNRAAAILIAQDLGLTPVC